MAVFITGASGFLGQSLVNSLLEQGRSVLAFDFNEPKPEVIAKWGKSVEFVKGDIRDSEIIKSLIEKSGTTDPIIHLAGVLTAGCDRDPQMAMAVNVSGTNTILESAVKNGLRRVVFASTIGVYGRNLPQPIVEKVDLEPDGWYGLTKRMAEEIGLLYVRRHNLDFRAVRFAAVTGSNRVAVGSASLFTSLIPEKAAKGEAYEIEVTPDTSYPVVYIKDAVDSILKLAYAESAPSRIYNISSGNVVVSEMIEHVLKIIPDAQFTFKPVEDIMAIVSGYKTWTINCDLAKKEINWEPTYTVGKMVEDIIAVIANGEKSK